MTVAEVPVSEVDTGPDPTGALDDRLRCAACGHVVTRAAMGIVVGGAHVHRFRNPAGWSYEVACFADAPGCTAAGMPTAEHTWFPGHLWDPAFCAACGRHLGWWYVGPTSFVGLIRPRLR